MSMRIMMMIDAKIWYFTFGTDTELANKYVKIHGTWDEAREK